jgi:hypothetical protein
MMTYPERYQRRKLASLSMDQRVNFTEYLGEGYTRPAEGVIVRKDEDKRRVLVEMADGSRLWRHVDNVEGIVK